MYNNGFSNGFNSGFGTGGYTSANNYGYTMPPVNSYQAPQPTQQQMPQFPLANTNIIYVNGIEDAKNRQQPINSVFLYRDNDKQVIYERTVDGKGQFDIKAYSLTDLDTEKKAEEEKVNNLSDYVLRTDFEALQGQIKGIETKLKKALVSIEMNNIDREAKANE